MTTLETKAISEVRNENQNLPKTCGDRTACIVLVFGEYGNYYSVQMWTPEMIAKRSWKSKSIYLDNAELIEIL